MKRKPIHRGGIASAGYDRTKRVLDVEFDTGRILRATNVGPETAERFLHSSAPHTYWKEEIEEVFSVHEISAKESDSEAPVEKKPIDELKRLFGDL
ncbi:KTSC domain-containing protein [Sutterella sp.]|uniref:KTSC domain-containing protein n=1 Tax=Sutterella sp. TaxID=1981025 RepID=UPI0026DED93C|nr:KTSC domain-containing protein [Sutterella sp.]MDO5531838.1 KTSC domain-containing protein [Sutterella sp.]